MWKNGYILNTLMHFVQRDAVKVVYINKRCHLAYTNKGEYIIRGYIYIYDVHAHFLGQTYNVV